MPAEVVRTIGKNREFLSGCGNNGKKLKKLQADPQEERSI
jgi:hypothetical protein